MKLLLLTDCPPCKHLTGGLVLDQLCRFLPQGSVVCFAVTNPDMEMKLTPDLSSIPIEYARKPRETGEWEASSSSSSRDDEIRAAAKEDKRRLEEVPPLIDRAVAFARQHRVDAVWAVLEGQTMVRMAKPVAERLKAPLFSLVWDPLSWWLSAHKVDPINTRLALKQFDETMMHSAACAAASWAMAEDYECKYKVRSVPVIASHDIKLAKSPLNELRSKDKIVVGMAGQFYASQEWHEFIAALNKVSWRLGDRDVYIKVLGRNVPATDVPDGRLDFMGWKSQPDAIRILCEETDVLYCPYPFDTAMEEVSRYSFPSKLPLYFAAGRPVVFHGPAYSSPSRYLLSRQAGLVCAKGHGSEVVEALGRVAGDPALYGRLAKAAQLAFRRDFTLEVMRSNFFTFLGLPDEKSALEELTPKVETPQQTATRTGLAMLPKTIARRIAFAIPKIRALYNYAQHLRQERDRIAVQAATAFDERRQALAARDSLSKHIEQLRSQLNDHRTGREVLAREVEQLRPQHDEYRKELEQQRVQLNDLRTDRDALAKEVEQLNILRDLSAAENECLVSKIRSLEEDLSLVTNEKYRLLEETRYGAIERQALKHWSDQCQERLHALYDEREQLASRLRASESARDSLARAPDGEGRHPSTAQRSHLRSAS
jgi:uncharacterized coiled-coil DUF342 family protein